MSAAALMMWPGAASAQFCLHGGALSENVFGTNCLGGLVAGKAHPGSTVSVLLRVMMNDDCTGDQTLVTNVTDTVNAGCTNFTTANLISNPILLTFFGQFIDITNTPDGFTYKYVVPLCATSPIIHTSLELARDTNSTSNPNGEVRGGGSAQLQILRPALCLGKQCVDGVGEDGLIVWTGSLTNCGNVVLTNVIVRNFFNGTNEIVVGPTTLAVGQVTNFGGSYRPVDPCSPSRDTLVAQGTDELFCTVLATNTATCRLVLTPGIIVNKFCPAAPVPPGGMLVFSGTVSNTGNVTLTNVTVVNNQPAPNTVVFGPVTLLPGQGRAFTNSYVVPINYTNCNISDTLTARGTNICTGLPITAVDTEICPIVHTLTIQCPTNRTVQCLADVPPPDTNAVIATSTAGGVIVTFLGQTIQTNGCAFIITRVYRAVDACTNMAMCTNMITVRDTIPPTLVGVPTNRTFQCLSDVPPVPIVTATDNCDTNVVITRVSTTNGACPLIITNTWTAVDDCTNTTTATQVIIVRDTIAPVLVGVPTNRTFQCLADVPPPATVIAVDNCDTNVPVTRVSTTNGTCPTIIVHCWTAVDDCTNTVTACQTNIVNDTIPPVLVGVPGNTNFQCLSDVPPPANVTATDNCDGIIPVTTTYVTNGSCPTIITCTWVARDRCTNSASATRTITVNDTIPPVLIGVPGNTNYQCLSQVPPPANVTATDNCDGTIPVTATYVTNGSCPTIITCTWRAQDRCTNSASATRTITVNDTIPPVLIGVPGNTNFQCLSDVPPPANVTATDNCDGTIPVTATYVTNGSCPTIITCTWVARDRCTNSASATRTITVNDTIPPVLVGVPGNTNYQCLRDVPPPANVTATDNCDGTIPVTATYVTNGTCPLIITCTWIARDRCTNSASATRTITVRDTIPPVLVGVPADTNVQCFADVPPANVSATDNCGTNVQLFAISSISISNCAFIIQRCWTAIDECSNSVSRCQTVTVLDTLAPAITCSPDRTVPCNGEVVFTRPTATDNCDTNVDIQILSTVITTNTLGQTVHCRTWEAADNCTNTARCTQCITVDTCPPDICVVKEIACLFPNNSCGPFGKTATGIKGDQDPAFCYSITVSNCGRVALTNVTVLDNQLGDLTTNYFASGSTVFPVGSTITRVFSMDWDEDTTNTVTVGGQSAQTGAAVSDFDSAIAHIKEARIVCQKLISSPADRDLQGRDDLVILPDDGVAYPVTYRVIVRNTGQADLSQVVILDPALAALGCPGQWIINDLRAGQSTNIELCTVMISCPAPITNNTVTVIGMVDDAGTNGCAYDINGTNITVRSTCEATLSCEVPAACRTTGGGRQDSPLSCPNDDGTRYVTHGGQVGAPVGERTCVIDTTLPNWRLGNPCIHGRWTHVRHAKGGLKGNFHARFFDTLDCACLDTNVGPNGVYGPGTRIGELCNPGDRISGPEPRKAPANKIVFTGVGDWADPNGRRAGRACLFRVDLEDRSEPGGSHPGGAKDPADRYRIRIWVLTASELAALESGDGLLSFRNAISACIGINVRDGVDIPNSCGPNGVRVFGVRPPDIDDGGELERGNHQIHPSIKNCDPANPTGPGLPNPKN